MSEKIRFEVCNQDGTGFDLVEIECWGNFVLNENKPNTNAECAESVGLLTSSVVNLIRQVRAQCSHTSLVSGVSGLFHIP
jgi:hypothetical protein